MGSRITPIIGFCRANFQLAIHPSVLDLKSGTGQTDGRTDIQRSSLHNTPPYGGGA